MQHPLAIGAECVNQGSSGRTSIDSIDQEQQPITSVMENTPIGDMAIVKRDCLVL